MATGSGTLSRCAMSPWNPYEVRGWHNQDMPGDKTPSRQPFTEVLSKSQGRVTWLSPILLSLPSPFDRVGEGRKVGAHPSERAELGRPISKRAGAKLPLTFIIFNCVFLCLLESLPTLFSIQWRIFPAVWLSSRPCQRRCAPRGAARKGRHCSPAAATAAYQHCSVVVGRNPAGPRFPRALPKWSRLFDLTKTGLLRIVLQHSSVGTVGRIWKICNIWHKSNPKSTVQQQLTGGRKWFKLIDNFKQYGRPFYFFHFKGSIKSSSAIE